MKKWVSLVCLLFMSIYVFPIHPANAAEVNAKPKVIPSLQQWSGGSGSFTITASSRIVIGADSALASTASIFQEDLKEMTGRELPIVTNGSAAEGDFLLATLATADSTIGDEGYFFEVEDFVTIRANTTTGVFYGTRTALQILEQDTAKSSIVKGAAKDFPKYVERGFMLDVARKFIEMRDLKQYVKFMSYYKMNDFQLHLSDNEIFSDNSRDNWNKYAAFRLESTKYPELTAKDGHYTKQEFRELQDLAEARGLNITPELESPAHALPFTKVRPDLVKDNLPVDHLDITRQETIDFVQDVWSEYLDGNWFDSETIHFGADEFDRRDSSNFDVYRQFLNTMNDFIKSKGKKAQMWGSLTNFPGPTVVDQDIVINAWNNGWQNPKDAVAQGYKIINTVDGYLYIVPKAGYYYDYLNKQFLYNNWTPTYFGGNNNLQEGEPNLLGGMFALWNDKLGKKVSSADVHDRVIDAMPVLAEKMWRGQSSDTTFADFDKLSDLLGVGPGVDLARKVKSAGEVVLHYPFEEGGSTTTADQSGNGYDGSLNGVSWSNEGVSGKSIVFDDREDHITTGLTTNGLPWTVSAWVNLEETAAAQSDEIILMESDYGALKLKQTGSPNVGLSRESYNFNFNAAIPTGRWVHISFQGDLSGTSLYMDGELKSRLTETAFLPSATIGSKTSSFLGAMDEFKIYNRLLTSKEIAAEAGSPPWTTNIAAHKPATASSLEVPQFTANLAFDEDESRSSRWSSGTTDNEWIYVDLEQSYDIKKVILKWEASYATGYKIQVSDDANVWRDVYTTTSGAGGVEVISFRAVENAQYVRMLGTKRAGTYGYSLYEFEVYPANPNDVTPVEPPIRYSQNFEDGSLGGWQQMTGINVGAMSIVEAPGNANEHALQLTANGASSLFVDQNSPAIKDGEIEFTITPKSSALREGVIFRYAGQDSWASIGFDNGSWYWVNAQDSYGVVTSNAAAALRNGVTSTIKVKYEGNKITFSVNGTTYFDGALPNLPTEAGKMGARVFGASTAVFDNFLYANNVDEVAVTGVKVDKATISLQEGETTELIATVLPGTATNKAVSWSSSDETVAKVDVVNGKAVVSAIKAGTATITVTTEVGGFTAVSKATVLPTVPTAASTSLTAPSTVKYGDNFTVNFGLRNVAESVYAQDVSIQYNSALMEFVSAESLVDGVSIIESKEGSGSLRLILASQGGEHGISGDAVIAAINFKAKQAEEPATGIISVNHASIGDGDGNETNVEASSVHVAFELAPVELTPDINNDGKVSVGDLAIVAANYGKTAADSDWAQAKRADVNGDGKIDVVDLAFIAQKILE
ncbi:MAG: family 20 glycosylhydrolase [Candidatus Pristimantibacillus sp.]